ncbi:MoaD/ThiS family protein [Nocardia sp. CY41]|uniref:MoaD/ThiS family protein n=1 Tax=Nocardia sp. CY41 TaxID=2608686 RepID=UPI001F3B87D2|nr:MoaD/ThiS family protein [Nocardia sp. CY41]
MDREIGATVVLPTMLRPHAAGNSKVLCSGSTVGEVLDSLIRQHPALKTRITTGENDIRRFVNVYVEDEDARALGGVAAPIRPGATVTILCAVAGG